MGSPRQTEILKQARKKMKMKQREVAEKAGIRLNQYQRLESGPRNIESCSSRIMLRICAVLGLDPYELVFGQKVDGRS